MAINQKIKSRSKKLVDNQRKLPNSLRIILSCHTLLILYEFYPYFVPLH